MRAAIMQPYFLPYVGYFQLMAAADVFVVYDDIQYTKSGWINRNRLLIDGHDVMITVPLQRDHEYLDVRDRRVSPAFDRAKLLRQIDAAYRKSPAFADGRRLVGAILDCADENLFAFLKHSIDAVRAHFGIDTPMVVSSTLGVDRALKGQERVIDTCRRVGATRYLNPEGGAHLYSGPDFAARGIELEFMQARIEPYPQPAPAFVPSLSILDLAMNVPMPEAREWLLRPVIRRAEE